MLLVDSLLAQCDLPQAFFLEPAKIQRLLSRLASQPASQLPKQIYSKSEKTAVHRLETYIHAKVINWMSVSGKKFTSTFDQWWLAAMITWHWVGARGQNAITGWLNKCCANATLSRICNGTLVCNNSQRNITSQTREKRHGFRTRTLHIVITIRTLFTVGATMTDHTMPNPP